MLTILYRFTKKVITSTVFATMVCPIVYAQNQQSAQQPASSKTVDQLIVKLKPSDGSQSSKLMGVQADNPQVKLQAVIDRVLAKQTHHQFNNRVTATENVAKHMSTRQAIDSNTVVLSLGGALPLAEADQLMKDIAADKSVEYVEEDALVQHFATPNDARFLEQWNLSNGIGGANLTAAWDHTVGSRDVVVAVIDTGYLPHEDLKDNLLPGYDFIPRDSYAANGGGFGSDGRDYGDGVKADDPNKPADCKARPSSWHGSHVAGIIGAATNNGQGIAGISWHGKILPVRVLGRCGGRTSDVVTGMRWAAGLRIGIGNAPTNRYPAKVLNLSLGSPALKCSQTYAITVRDIRNAGASIVVAAGNDTTNVASVQPANCDGVIAVSATDSLGRRAPWSNYGPKVKISAPGVNILSTVSAGLYSAEQDSYANMSGTSMAAPHVSGTIALMLAANPKLTPDHIIQILQFPASVRPFPDSSCTTTQCGAGLLDVGKVVELVKQGSF